MLVGKQLSDQVFDLNPLSISNAGKMGCVALHGSWFHLHYVTKLCVGKGHLCPVWVHKHVQCCTPDDLIPHCQLLSVWMSLNSWE